jgi:Inhibitor of Apoptosis domain
MGDFALWSALEFARWFSEKGAGKEVQAQIVLQDITGDVASALDDASLAHLGVEDPGLRVHLLQELRLLVESGEEIPEPAGQAYYYNTLPEHVATLALAERGEGEYLVRDTDTGDGFGFVISAVYQGQVVHTIVPFEPERRVFVLSDGQEFGAFRSVLDAYIASEMIGAPVTDATIAQAAGGERLVVLSEQRIQQFGMSDDPSQDPYFHANLTTEMARDMLVSAGMHGAFLVWRGPNGLVLSFISENTPVHILIVRGHDGSLNVKSGQEYVRHTNVQEMVFYWWQSRVLCAYIPYTGPAVPPPSLAPTMAPPPQVSVQPKRSAGDSFDESDMSSDEEVVYGSFSQFLDKEAKASRESGGAAASSSKQASEDNKADEEDEVIVYGAIPRESRAAVRFISTADSADSSDEEGGVIVYGAVPRTMRDIKTLRDVDRKKSKRRRKRSGSRANRPAPRQRGKERSRRSQRRRKRVPDGGVMHPRMASLDMRLNTTVPRVGGKHVGMAWPHQRPSKEQIAKAGFYYSAAGCQHYDVSDLIICFGCGVKLSKFQEGEDVVERHRASSPDCPLFKPEMQETLVRLDVEAKAKADQPRQPRRRQSRRTASRRSNRALSSASQKPPVSGAKPGTKSGAKTSKEEAKEAKKNAKQAKKEAKDAKKAEKAAKKAQKKEKP